MSTPNRRHRVPQFRPDQEMLEGRVLLSKVVRGVDTDGDQWVMQLFGPGDVAVVNQNGSNTRPVPLGQPALIKSITIGGANPGATKLVGVVEKAAGGDGKVFFQTMEGTASDLPGLGVGVGMLGVDMPDFWLGATNPSATSPGSINFENGIVTLRFGGVDTTAFGISANGKADKFSINLGLPTRTGTSIVIDRSISATQSGTGTTVFQDTVDFNVTGRLNLFQANSIEGSNPLNLGALARYEAATPGAIGTTVRSTPATATRLGGVTGFIGRVRVGGNARNLILQVISATGDNGGITNLSIGGETNQVTIDAGEVMRHAQFGLGMDTVALTATRMQYVGANRGAVGSSVLAQRDGGLFSFGGDVQNTQVLAGYTTSSGDPVAQELGRMTVLVAGDVTDSLFAASVNPNEDGIFGSEDDLNGIMGEIQAKVEGTIDNSLNPDVDPASAGQAFFARRLQVANGPITPPAAPGAPYHVTKALPRTPVAGLGGGPKGPAYKFVRNQGATSQSAARRA